MKKFACVFPGQGSQKVGMGHDVFQIEPSVQALFKQGDEVLGRSLSTLCFEGPDEELVKTANAQPGLFLVSTALFSLLQAKGFKPSFVAGHSLGELTAYAASQVLPFTDALKVIQARGQAMAAAYPSEKSAMAAVMGSTADIIQATVASISSGVVVAANFNAPSQTVISGEKQAVLEAIEALKALGAKVIPLNVSGAFHSPLMQSASEHLKTFIEPVSFSKAQVPIVLNRSAAPETEAAALKENLSLQVISSVRWVETVQFLAQQVDVIVEVGSGKVLAGLIKKIAPEVVVENVSDKASLDAFVSTYLS